MCGAQDKDVVRLTLEQIDVVRRMCTEYLDFELVTSTQGIVHLIMGLLAKYVQKYHRNWKMGLITQAKKTSKDNNLIANWWFTVDFAFFYMDFYESIVIILWKCAILLVLWMYDI